MRLIVAHRDAVGAAGHGEDDGASFRALPSTLAVSCSDSDSDGPRPGDSCYPPLPSLAASVTGLRRVQIAFHGAWPTTDGHPAMILPP